MIGDDDVVGKSGGKSLDHLQQSDINAVFRLAKFVGKKLRQNIVNVQNDFCPGQLGQPGAEHQKIRHVMNVHQIIFVFPMQTAETNEDFKQNRISRNRYENLLFSFRCRR